MRKVYKIPLVLTPQPEGGYTVTSPALPELVTEGDTLEEAVDHVQDALHAVLEAYDDMHKPIPTELCQDSPADRISFEYVVASG